MPAEYAFDAFRLDIGRRVLTRDGEVLPLTPKAFDTLAYLVQRAGTVVEKDELMAALWPDTVVEESNLSQNIYTVRRLLGEARGEHRYIATIPGRGYQFVATVATIASEANLATIGGARPSSSPRRRTMFAAVAAIVVLAAMVAAFAILRARTHAAAGPIRSVAVLPFKPLLPHDRDHALELGMTETMIARLGSMRELTVPPLSRVRPFGSPSVDPFEAGRKLGVDAVLDSHVQRRGDRIRVTARLVRVADETQLWMGQFDEKFTDIFAVQDSISRRVAGELAVELTDDEWQRVVKRSTDDPKAYEAYLKGRLFISLGQPNRAIDGFEEAVQRDPQFALAHAGLADIYSRRPVAAEVPASVAMPRAIEAAEKAVALDPDLPEAHAALGWINFYYHWDWQRSEAEFRRALALSPHELSALLGYAHLLSNTGRTDEALRQVDAAIRLDRLSPITNALKAQFLFNAGRNAEAMAQAGKTLENNPTFWIAHLQLGRCYSREGRYDEALRELEKARETPGTTIALAYSAIVLAEAGRAEEARKVFDAMQALARRGSVSSYNVALAARAAGDPDAALDWLERAYAEKDVRLVFLDVEPAWEPLRGNRRFVALARRLKLAE